MIPVKTICTIIDVQFKDQDGWLKNHPYYSQLYRMSGMVAADNKVRQMNCLPIFDVLSWLSSIAERNRSKESIEKQHAFMLWLRTQMLDMYKLVEIFREENKYELEAIAVKSKRVEDYHEHLRQASEAKKAIKRYDSILEDIRTKRFTGQTALPFPESGTKSLDK